MWWEGDGEEEEEATKEDSRKPSDNTEDTKMFV